MHITDACSLEKLCKVHGERHAPSDTVTALPWWHRGQVVTLRTTIAARIVHYVQEEMPEAVFIAALVKGTADCCNLLRCWCDAGSKLCGMELLLLLLTTEQARLLLTLLLWLLGGCKQAELLLVLLLWLLCCTKNAWLTLLLAKSAAVKIVESSGLAAVARNDQMFVMTQTCVLVVDLCNNDGSLSRMLFWEKHSATLPCKGASSKSRRG